MEEREIISMNLRKYFLSKLTGHGLEIGPLHKPMELPPGVFVDYVDRLTVKEMREHYPEFDPLPLTEPTILDDAQELNNINIRAYDFLIASHVIEHMKDPLTALLNWEGVIKPEGLIYLIIPDYRKIFDRDRRETSIFHILIDFIEGSSERDLKHYLEYSQMVDGKEGDEIRSHAAELIKRGYSIHYHCFTPESFTKLLWVLKALIDIEIVEGPVSNVDDHEFHFLLRKV